MAVEIIEIKDANGVNQRVYVDKIGTDNVQVIKPGFGADDTLTLVSSTNGLPVNVVAGSATGTEYAEGASDTTITGTAILWEDSGDVLRAVSAAKPMPVQIASGTVALSGEDHIGEVGGSTAVIKPTVTISTSGYSAGDVIGGKITLTNAMRKVNGTGVLQSLSILDTDNEKAALTVILFSADITSPADNAAWAWTSADFSKVLGTVSVATSDYVTVGGEAIATISGIGLPVAATGSTAHIYAVVVASSAPTYGATTDFRPAFHFLRD